MGNLIHCSFKCSLLSTGYMGLIYESNCIECLKLVTKEYANYTKNSSGYQYRLFLLEKIEQLEKEQRFETDLKELLGN